MPPSQQSPGCVHHTGAPQIPSFKVFMEVLLCTHDWWNRWPLVINLIRSPSPQGSGAEAANPLVMGSVSVASGPSSSSGSHLISIMQVCFTRACFESLETLLSPLSLRSAVPAVWEKTKPIFLPYQEGTGNREVIQGKQVGQFCEVTFLSGTAEFYQAGDLTSTHQVLPDELV